MAGMVLQAGDASSTVSLSDLPSVDPSQATRALKGARTQRAG
ncbi:hypothetical protein CLV54_1051 [Compostimonas suwonensis]|uniref:Uncharacterized protein n=1 Tax=Compostimonas suwonensis TaxID=1048394 RepID=A0A2M9BZ92_9MICO|nr:hypothetical protein CLV54_1051 [Compostimonas suwonensis]